MSELDLDAIEARARQFDRECAASVIFASETGYLQDFVKTADVLALVAALRRANSKIEMAQQMLKAYNVSSDEDFDALVGDGAERGA